MADNNLNLYKIDESPGKGKGVFACQDIQAGTRIWEESPLVLSAENTRIDIFVQYDILDRTEPELVRQFNSLSHCANLPPVPGHHPTAQQVIYNPPPGGMVRGLTLACEALGQSTEMNASGVRVQKSQFAGLNLERNLVAIVLSIFDSNAFCTPQHKKDRTTQAVFATGGRLNHSCVSNCNAIWNNDTKKLCVHATRDIAAGEELLIMYREGELVYMQREERLKLLKALFNFDCGCPACDPSSKSSTRMDELADSLYKIRPYLLTGNEYYPGLVGEYTKALNLMKEDENLDNWLKGTM